MKALGYWGYLLYLCLCTQSFIGCRCEQPTDWQQDSNPRFLKTPAKLAPPPDWVFQQQINIPVLGVLTLMHEWRQTTVCWENVKVGQLSTRTDVVAPKTIRGEKKRQEERTRLNWPHSTIAFYFILTKQEKGELGWKVEVKNFLRDAAARWRKKK